MSSRSGFTLVELSIVLVIIGLVVGGVTVGRDLINSSQVRKGISNLEQMGTAINSFKIKYSCIPGDCPNTLDFFPTGIYGGNGNGDGFINDWPNESFGANDSLVAANLIPKAQVKADPVHGQGKYLACYNDAYAYFYFADLYSISNDFNWTYGSASNLPNAIKRGITYSCTNWSGNSINAPSLSPNDALNMDTKIDDGLPQTGKFMAQNSAGLCTVPTQNAYLRSNTLGCRFVYYLPVGN